MGSKAKKPWDENKHLFGVSKGLSWVFGVQGPHVFWNINRSQVAAARLAAELLLS